jgi:hypothetical protein
MRGQRHIVNLRDIALERGTPQTKSALAQASKRGLRRIESYFALAQKHSGPSTAIDIQNNYERSHLTIHCANGPGFA